MNIKIIGLICLLMFHCQKGNNDSKTVNKDTINSENNNKEVKKQS